MGEEKHTIRTVIVDDNADFLRAAELMLKELAPVEIVGRAQSGEAAIDLVNRLQPDLVLLDLLLPGMNGDATARCITSSSTGSKVILMSLFFTDGADKRVCSTGAHGFVDKEFFAEQIKPLLGTLFGSMEPG